MIARFWAQGTPAPQPRPRVTKAGASYNPKSADGWKEIVRLASRPFRPDQPLEGAVEVEAVFFLPRPQRLMRRRDPDGPIPAPVRPDLDNLEKAVLDALDAERWFHDDGQVVALVTRKMYPEKDGRPGAWITIRSLDV